MNLISCIDANILLEASRVYALINFIIHVPAWKLICIECSLVRFGWYSYECMQSIQVVRVAGHCVIVATALFSELKLGYFRENQQEKNII